MVLLDIKKYNRELTFRSFLSALPTGRQATGRLVPINMRTILLAFLFFLVTFYFSLVTVSNAEAPRRIISLAPSITEILFAAGLEDKIVGVTNFCDYPEEAKEKPKIGGMSNPSLEAVVLLEPDIVIMTTDGNPKEFGQRLRSMKIRTYVFKSRRLSELQDGIRRLGIALDEEDKFNPLALSIEQALKRFRAPSKQPAGKLHTGQAGHETQRKKVIFILWPEPLIVAGPRTAINDAINLLGGINIAEVAKSRYPKYSIEEIIRQSPDIIFFGKGKGMDKISVKLLKRLSSVSAVKNKKVFYVSDNLYRLGPRVINGLEELAGYLDK
jgi:iron complex transport system substrate-binding protein